MRSDIKLIIKEKVSNIDISILQSIDDAEEKNAVANWLIYEPGWFMRLLGWKSVEEKKKILGDDYFLEFILSSDVDVDVVALAEACLLNDNSFFQFMNNNWQLKFREDDHNKVLRWLTYEPGFVWRLLGWKSVAEKINGYNDDTVRKKEVGRKYGIIILSSSFTVPEDYRNKCLVFLKNIDCPITLISASSEDNSGMMVKCFLNLGEDPNQVNSENKTALYIACEKGYVNTVKHLLDHDADLEVSANDGTTPLIVACEKGYVDVVKLLLNYRADVRKADNNDHTPLMVACVEGHVEVVTVLLTQQDIKAQVDNPIADNGVTLLMLACFNGQTELVEILIKAGANVNKTSANNHTPLMWAITNGHDEIVTLLLEGGAKSDEAVDGVTPLGMARKNGHEKVVRLLLNAGAKDNESENASHDGGLRAMSMFIGNAGESLSKEKEPRKPGRSTEKEPRKARPSKAENSTEQPRPPR